MHIDESTFKNHKDAADLLGRMQDALESLSGKPQRGKYAVPRKLKPLTRPFPGGEPPRLKTDYIQIWNSCFIVFDPNERGASVHIPTGKIRFGPFFVTGWTRPDLEKVILHEYLHKAISMQPDFGPPQFRKDAQHGEIDHIIESELRYKGHPRGNRNLD